METVLEEESYPEIESLPKMETLLEVESLLQAEYLLSYLENPYVLDNLNIIPINTENYILDLKNYDPSSSKKVHLYRPYAEQIDRMVVSSKELKKRISIAKQVKLYE